MKFKVGDRVVASGNYHDEQLGQFATADVQTIIEIQSTDLEGTSGQWVKTDHEPSWTDSYWFDLAE